MEVLYEDNHIIIINKAPGEIVQGDKTGDVPLSKSVKSYIKEKYAKPGAVFLGVPHRLDRPVSGIVVFARTSKALSRLNEMFRMGQVRKTYHAIVKTPPGHPPAGNADGATAAPSAGERRAVPAVAPVTLTHWLTRNERQNKSYAHSREVPGGKRAVLDYRPLARSDRYTLLEVRLHTGRHHQIRCQLAAAGLPIRGDLKYGAPRSNPDGSISLHARTVAFEHPVSHRPVSVEAPYPDGVLWQALAGAAEGEPTGA